MTPAELQAGLARIFGDCADLRRLSGGASQETYAFTADGRELILRRRPDAAPPSEDRRSPGPEAEAAAIRAVAAHGGTHAPAIAHVLSPADGIGRGYVMVKLEGETLGRRIVRDAAFDAVRPRLPGQCGAILAEIHATPPPETELATYDAAAAVDRFEAGYRTVGAERPVLELAFRWLRERLPAPEPLTLVHGDFRNGNIMFHPEKGAVAALDWELVHIGDPAEDMGWICTASWRFGNYGKPVGGFGDYAQLLDGYAAAGGREISVSRVQFWQALGSLNWSIGCLGMYMSFANGVDRSVERPMIGRRVSENEIDLLNLMEAAS